MPSDPALSTLPYTTLFRSQFENVDVLAREVLLERRWCTRECWKGAPVHRHDLAHAEPLRRDRRGVRAHGVVVADREERDLRMVRSEEHTSELQSHVNLVCRPTLLSPLFPTRRSSDLSSRTSMFLPARCCLSAAGVPVSAGKVPQCIGTTWRTPSHSAAIAAVSGPMV